MKKRMLGSLVLLIVLVTVCAVSVGAENVDFSAGGTVNGYCQHCKTNVQWKPLTETVSTGWGTNYSEANGTHYYVADDEVRLAGGILTIAAGEELCLHLNGTFTMTGGTITGGKVTVGESSTGMGGNIFISAGATVDISNATITNGTAAERGGNLVTTGTTLTLKITNSTISGGSAGELGNCMYFTGTAKLVVTKDFAGEATVCFNKEKVSTPVRGGTVASTAATCEGVFTGKLMIENDAQYPTAYAKENDSTLYINAAAVVGKDGTKTWYGSNADAVAAYDSNTKYLVAMEGDLALNGDYTVDLCGANVAVTGSGAVTFIDTANKDFETYGSATVSGVTIANEISTVIDGMPYIMMEENGVYTVHCMGVKLTGVSIRPSSSGVYYTGQWNYDEKLATMIETFGVAVSLAQMPTADFKNDETCLYTGYDASELSSGVQKTGAIIEDILDEALIALKNNKRGRLPIYAQAYVTLKNNGPVIVGNNGQDESLYSSMLRLDQLIKEDVATSKAYLSNAREFYNKWKDKGMDSWGLKNIPVFEKVNDGKLNLLMVGNSYCYYYVEELYALLAENMPEGITEVNVYNVYHSGCRVNTHYQKWVNDEGYYTIYRTNAEGRVALTDTYKGTLEEALAMEEDWDYISLHGNVTGWDYTNEDTLEDQCKAIVTNIEPLLDRFHDLFPNAQLLWQRTWASELGRVSDDVVWTEEYAKAYEIGMQYVCDYLCNEWDQDKPYDPVMVNSGAAWTLAREAEAGKNLLPFGGLCARLGYSSYGDSLEGYTGETANSGDGYHEGDIGGAQLMNAYSWYETLTGKDCRETVYRPVYTYGGTEYTLSEELVTIMQNAVHGVISQMPETVKPAA